MSAVPEHPSVIRARTDAEVARSRMLATLHELQARVAPRHLAEEAWENVREKGTTLANDAVTVAKQQPATVAAAGGVLLAFLARHKIAGAAKALFSRKPKTSPETPPPYGVVPAEANRDVTGTVAVTD